MGPHPAVAAIRLAVRRTLRDVLQDAPGAPAGSFAPHRRPPLVLVACSGGADSMALASALAFEAPRLGLRAGGLTVDHGLQPGSGDRAREVVCRLTELSLEPAEALTVAVGRDGGPEAAARTARYTALDEAADRLGAAAVLLGHTRDDQAETVLLGLARGSGTRSLSGMAAVSGSPAGRRDLGHRYLRPFLTVDRQTTRKACMVQSLPVWDDPHNTDPAFTRSRVRHDALPALEKALGKGVVEALARTAQLSRDDADALDAWAREAEREVRAELPPSRRAPRPASRTGGGGRDGDAANVADLTEESGSALDVARLGALPPAVRRRVLRRAAVAAGSPAGSLFARHIEEVDRLVTEWHGQRAITLPGRVAARRQGGTLVIRQV
ncbi:tRNA lysidine(34) synthetase TilS [Streptomyces verrucosisporus]|uniref:tRNA lysidine(34) synthetase TilS n=1 Tax=Streptomyces verrucosisporus TaxID=1695161 RepID=UPI0019CFB68A|nr:tRNA lysidine(34) synthetase TilS [Streptomyces verrucosisporus]MBN3931808.1 tRNA lysidine(34) synthetase TilS [Streptomyces verrucosisporus]